MLYYKTAQETSQVIIKLSFIKIAESQKIQAAYEENLTNRRYLKLVSRLLSPKRPMVKFMDNYPTQFSIFCLIKSVCTSLQS